MTWKSKAGEGMPILNNPNWRTHRTPDSFWVTFTASGKARYSRGQPPPGLPHGPFLTRAAAKKYVRSLGG